MLLLLIDRARDKKLQDDLADGDITGYVVPLVMSCVTIIACSVWAAWPVIARHL
ncbi:hypothetical protein [Bradyrhizobium sp. SZCCHNS3053]|uniref:hypothetical protein n=1 Tax=Bradyrhizobium sp. SZCCHNS3053 TaxID=3057322 RepID=UPI00291702E9|nr:hypothetical protein [Bradyrhizobium sp. SZCCHNS3053]